MDLTLATVVSVEDGSCTIDPVGDPGPMPAGYTGAFAPRAGSLAPGQLVAYVDTKHGPKVAWRWFTATVVEATGDTLVLDEPFHGRVEARRRAGLPPPTVGDTVYVSIGLVHQWRVDALAGDGDPVDYPAVAASTFNEIRDAYGRLNP